MLLRRFSRRFTCANFDVALWTPACRLCRLECHAPDAMLSQTCTPVSTQIDLNTFLPSTRGSLKRHAANRTVWSGSPASPYYDPSWPERLLPGWVPLKAPSLIET